MASNSVSQKSLVEKIGVLLGHQQPPENLPAQPLQENLAYRPERCLVAWVLLTRLEQDKLEQVWKRYGSTILEPFALSYLLHHDTDSSSSSTARLAADDGCQVNQPQDKQTEENREISRSKFGNLPASRGLYLRLVAQIMARLPSKLSPTNHNNKTSHASSTITTPPSTEKSKSSLGVTLIQEWKRFSKGNENKSNIRCDNYRETVSTLPIHLDILKALESWMEHDPTVAERLKLLELIWNHFCSLNPSFMSGSIDDPSKGGDHIDIKESLPSYGVLGSVSSTIESNGTVEPNSLSDWELMTLTLDGILQSDIVSNAGAPVVNNGEKMDGSFALITTWRELVLSIFQSYGNEVLPDTMVPLVIEWLTDSNNIRSLSPTVCQAWHEWLLTMIQTRIPYDQPFRLQVFQQNGYRTLAQLNQLLLAHVVSPIHNESNASLRALAWQTMITLVEACGWQWVLMIATAQNSSDFGQADAIPSSSRLGMAANLCTWIRLASGEWQIQLQAISSNSSNSVSSYAMSEIPISSDHRVSATSIGGQGSQHATPSDRSNSNIRAGTTAGGASPGWQQATALPVGNACARLMIGVVHFCVKLEEQQHHPKRRMPQLSVDALFHLRASLQTSLFTTVEYLQLQHQEQQLADSWSDYEKPVLRQSISSASSASFETIAVRLLGTLLMEIDIWLLQPSVDVISGGGDDSIQINHGNPPTSTTTPETEGMIRSVLECLQTILPDSQDYSLLPGIVSVLAGAESAASTDPKLVDSVMSGFWDPLVDYLEGYWQRDNTTPVNSRTGSVGNSGDKLNDTVAWACSCTEMYVSLDDNARTSATTKHRHRRLALSLIEWIQTVLQVDSQQLWSPPSTPPTVRPSRSPASSPSFSTPRSSTRKSSSKLTLHKLQSYLSLAVGCYMTLSKNSEQPPREHESRVIFRALQVCEMKPQSIPQPPPPPAPPSQH